MSLQNYIASDASLRTTLINKISELKQYPERGKTIFRTNTKLEGNVKSEATVRNFNIKFDEPEELGGNNSAPNPVEYLLASLGACQEILYGAYAAVLEIPLESVKVNVKGTLDLQGLFGLNSQVKPGFTDIQYDTVIKSPTDKAVVQQLVDTVEKNCPVLDTLVRAISVTGKVTIVTPVRVEQIL